MSRPPILEQVPHRPQESFDCEVIDGPDYGTRWHFHPEIQITLAIKSQGYRIVGDNISPLRDGDCVLIGSDVPHVWQQDRSEAKDAVKAVIVRFRRDFLGTDWLQRPEMERVNKLLQRARRGLNITGRTGELVSARLQELSTQEGLRRVITLMEVLDVLSRSNELKPLASASFRPVLEATDQERMGRILRCIEEQLTEDLTRDDLAKVASLSAGAFSRYFKSRTGRSLPEYVNELRIGRACRMLAESENAVTDIAFDCGYRNLANFNRWFLKLTGHAPRDYRRKMSEGR
jgi:AraC-like DNA-binding protein